MREKLSKWRAFLDTACKFVDALLNFCDVDAYDAMCRDADARAQDNAQPFLDTASYGLMWRCIDSVSARAPRRFTIHLLHGLAEQMADKGARDWIYVATTSGPERSSSAPPILQ